LQSIVGRPKMEDRRKKSKAGNQRQAVLLENWIFILLIYCILGFEIWNLIIGIYLPTFSPEKWTPMVQPNVRLNAGLW
jgi:hypothetical protein